MVGIIVLLSKAIHFEYFLKILLTELLFMQ